VIDVGSFIGQYMDNVELNGKRCKCSKKKATRPHGLGNPVRHDGLAPHDQALRLSGESLGSPVRNSLSTIDDTFKRVSTVLNIVECAVLILSVPSIWSLPMTGP